MTFNPQPKLTKKKEKSERKKWHRKCWKLMSEWVRRKDADPFTGLVSCYTCPRTLHWKEMNAGHWKHGKMDFDERHVRCQCPACNLFFSGRLDEYTLRLVRENGVEWVNALRLEAGNHQGYSLQDLKRIHAELTEKISNLK